MVKNKVLSFLFYFAILLSSILTMLSVVFSNIAYKEGNNAVLSSKLIVTSNILLVFLCISLIFDIVIGFLFFRAKRKVQLDNEQQIIQ